MRYDARFCVAVRGPLEQVRKLPELPQEWFASLNESDQTEDVKSDVGAFLWDEEGNEYFLGSVIDVNIDDIDSKVDWNFSDDCDWIPKSLFRNC